MSDQAEGLRRHRVRQPKNNQPVSKRSGTLRGIAVASGKGGVGKTNTVANLAYILQKQGKRVLVFDADMGLGNLHILLGLSPRYNIQHVMDGEKRMEEIILKGPGGIDVLPAGSGHRSYSELNGEEMLSLKTELEAMEDNYDVILFDIGAGISANVMYFCSAAMETAIITSSEPTSFADAYALIKVLSRDYHKTSFKLIVNAVANKREADMVHKRLVMVADRFSLGCQIEMFGHIVRDETVTKAVRQQRLYCERYPTSPASMCVKELANTLILDVESESGVTWDMVFSA